MPFSSLFYTLRILWLCDFLTLESCWPSQGAAQIWCAVGTLKLETSESHSDWRKRRATRPALSVETFSQGLKAILSESWTRSPALYLRVSFLFFCEFDPTNGKQMSENCCRGVWRCHSSKCKSTGLSWLSWAVKHFAVKHVPFLFPGPSHRPVKALHTGKGAAKVWRLHRILMTFNVLLIPLVRVRASHHLSRRRAKAQFEWTWTLDLLLEPLVDYSWQHIWHIWWSYFNILRITV